MAQKNTKKTKTKAKPAAVAKAKKQKEAVASRIEKELAAAPQPPAQPEVVGIIEKQELKQLLACRETLMDYQHTTGMLKTAYNTLLSNIRSRYGLPEECIIDDETGVVRSVPNG